ncbi:YeiH family putative sulfate export transporter [Dickeya sp. CFBP 2040]|uniref:YeiH family protein n=1 Tax=Dickeya sp. CFBP 2040 TaxID=2718531 RepID=UPI0014459727|nr:YeiH family protein [Dickeya sp. CFBP 2040]NKI74459.1 YeiH family putative sulfate export transporter [Dickeya sp. CFBP 2040]
MAMFLFFPRVQRLFSLSSLFNAGYLLTGIILTGLLTQGALRLSAMPMIAGLGLGSLTLAILVGMVLGNTVYSHLQPWCDAGVQWSRHYLLRWGIILYGFKLSFQQLTTIGAAGLVIDLLTLTSTLLLAYWLGRRWFQLDGHTALLIGAGSSICGAAAVLATAPVLKSTADKVAVAVSTVVLFGTTAMFLYPWMYQHFIQYSGWLFTPQTFGVYLGSTVHEVAQVVAAGHAISPVTENTAVIGKMLRVMMLAPFLFLLGLWLKQRQPAQQSVTSASAGYPWFALGFVMVCGINSLDWLPAGWVAMLTQLDNVLLTMAMVALGLATRLNTLRQAGIKPLLLAAILFIWLVAGGAAINLAVQHLFA